MLLIVFFLSGTPTPVAMKPILTITAPQRMETLKGSCVQIPCIFNPYPSERFDSTKDTYGVWIKNGPWFGKDSSGEVIYDSSGKVTTYPMKMIGNLTQNNCTTLFYNLTRTYSNVYHFRIENGPFKAIAASNPLHIIVNDEPPTPQISITGELKEGNPLNVTCSAIAPCPQQPPDLKWNLPWRAENQLEENADRTITASSKVTFTASDSLDGVNITCSAAYPVDNRTITKTAEWTVTLNVSYSPKDTSASISPTGPVPVGSWVNLTCSSRANPPVSHFNWFYISENGPKNVSGGGFYSFNVTVNDEGVYYCVATNDIGNQNSSVRLTIERPEQRTSSGPIEAILGGVIGVVLLICLVVSVWWLRSRHPTQQQTQNRLGKEPAIQAEEDIHYEEIDFSKNRLGKEPANQAEEVIHYGEIDFSKVQPKQVSSDGVPVRKEQQESEYAEVKVNQPTDGPVTQPAKLQDDLYAQV